MNGFKVDVAVKGKKCLLWHKWNKWSKDGITYWKCERCTAKRITGDNVENIDWDFFNTK